MFDEVLGNLVEIPTNHPIDGYSTNLDTSQGTIELCILLYETPLEETLPLAYAFVESIESHLATARSMLLTDFLPMHNSGYLEEGALPLTEKEFIHMAGVPSASIDLDGEIQLTYHHEELLWGHFMGVSIHPDGSVNTNLAG